MGVGTTVDLHSRGQILGSEREQGKKFTLFLPHLANLANPRIGNYAQAHAHIHSQDKEPFESTPPPPYNPFPI